jgi:hypothetical protein
VPVGNGEMVKVMVPVVGMCFALLRIQAWAVRNKNKDRIALETVVNVFVYPIGINLWESTGMNVGRDKRCTHVSSTIFWVELSSTGNVPMEGALAGRYHNLIPLMAMFPVHFSRI